MITEPAYQQKNVKDSFLMRKVDWIQVKDHGGPCAIYQVLCLKKHALPEEEEMCRKHNLGMEAYRQRNFHQAIQHFEEVLMYDVPSYVDENYDGEDKAATLMIRRCNDLISDPPPPDWDIARYGAI